MKLRTILSGAIIATLSALPARAGDSLLNASFDISRELFEEVNQAFIPHYKDKHGTEVKVAQSHGGSTRQANSILEGLAADVVTFNQVNDVLLLVNGGLIDKDWADRYPNSASPFVSVHGILVRKGNPKGIRDWSDLTKEGVEIVQVNPKTGGNGRYAVLSYYGYALEEGKNEAERRGFVRDVLKNVVVFEQGGRAATAVFTEREIGDVLVTFESEARALAAAEPEKFEVVTPSVSVQSEFPVAVVDKNADKRGTRKLAEAYLSYLYEPEVQRIIARNHYRPLNEEVAAEFADQLPPIKTLNVEDRIGPWSEVNETFFGSDGLVDQLLGEIGRSF